MNQNQIKDAAAHYQAEYMMCLGGFFNQVFLIRDKEREYVLKAYNAKQASFRQLQSELIWMQSLRESGVAVPENVKTLAGEQILTIRYEEDIYFYIAFHKMEGTIVQPAEWNNEFYHLWGKALGKMHRAASTFDEPDEEFDLPHWSTSPHYLAIHESFDDKMFNIYQDMITYSTTLPISNETFGIIHHDFHHENFFIHQKEVRPFDFGDTQYNYFFYDLVVTIYHAVQSINVLDRGPFLEAFMTNLFRGYQSEYVSVNRFGDWVEQLPSFLAYRRMYSYGYLQLYLPEHKKAKLEPTFNKMKQDILTETPVVEMPSSLIKQVQSNLLVR